MKKQLLYEWYNVLLGKEAKVMRRTHLTKKEKDRIRQYWKGIRGRNIPLYWHRNYYGCTGKLDEQYIPDYLYTTQLEPKCNPDRIARVLNDKSLIEFLFARVIDRTEQITVPNTLGGFGKFFYDEKRMPITRQELINKLCLLSGDYMIKPCVGESAGHHVRLLQLEQGIDLKTQENISRIIHSYGSDFIIQERIKMHEKYEDLHPQSCNTLRVMSYRVEGGIKCAPIALRIGVRESYLDNAHAGGIYIAVFDNGKLGKYAYDSEGNKYDRHPDTGIVFEDYDVPCIKRVIDAVKILHACVPNLGFLHWDLCINHKSQIVVIECNMSCGSLWLLQKAHGRGAFGEDTEYVMSLLRGRDG